MRKISEIVLLSALSSIPLSSLAIDNAALESPQYPISKEAYHEASYQDSSDVDYGQLGLGSYEARYNLQHNETAEDDTDSSLTGLPGMDNLVALPGEDIDFSIKLHSSSHHFINGKVVSDIGKMRFKSRLMPSNEVKLSMTLKQREADDVILSAYFDLANYTMELDGANSVLNKEHKQLLNVATVHLRNKLVKQYDGYELPEHALMLAQMMSYWSASPEGFVHEKRSIVSR